MQIMIISDSHWLNCSKLTKIINEARSTYQIDYCLHCGDIFTPYKSLNIPHFYVVKGNNDYGDLALEQELTIDNLNILMVHGHKYGVEYDLDLLKARSKNKYDLVCFGHTHKPYLEYDNNTIYINPGSAAFPRGSYPNPTYVVFDTNTKETIFVDIEKKEVCDPFKPCKKPSFKDIFKL